MRLASCSCTRGKGHIIPAYQYLISLSISLFITICSHYIYTCIYTIPNGDRPRLINFALITTSVCTPLQGLEELLWGVALRCRGPRNLTTNSNNKCIVLHMLATGIYTTNSLDVYTCKTLFHQYKVQLLSGYQPLSTMNN